MVNILKLIEQQQKYRLIKQQPAYGLQYDIVREKTIGLGNLTRMPVSCSVALGFSFRDNLPTFVIVLPKEYD